MTTATTSRANPNARERRRDVPGFLDDPEDVVPAAAAHRGASREWLRERTRQALQLCRAVPRRSSRRRGRKVRSAWSTSRAQAVAWEKEAMVAVRHGRLRASTPTTVRQAGIALITGMLSGAILDRSGKPYKPKTVRSYEHSLDTYIYPLLGSRKVSSLRRADIQGFVEEMRARGAASSTVHNRCG